MICHDISLDAEVFRGRVPVVETHVTFQGHSFEVIRKLPYLGVKVDSKNNTSA